MLPYATWWKAFLLVLVRPQYGLIKAFLVQKTHSSRKHTTTETTQQQKNTAANNTKQQKPHDNWNHIAANTSQRQNTHSSKNRTATKNAQQQKPHSSENTQHVLSLFYVCSLFLPFLSPPFSLYPERQHKNRFPDRAWTSSGGKIIRCAAFKQASSYLSRSISLCFSPSRLLISLSFSPYIYIYIY